MTPWWERVFPSGRDLTEIDAERYILIVRNWGRRQYKKLEKSTNERDELLDLTKCEWCDEQGSPSEYMGSYVNYCGQCLNKK